MCTLPLLVLLAVPFLGWQTTAYLAGGLLVADLFVCWLLCAFRVPQEPEGLVSKRLKNVK
jgi:hypothetical protein